MELWFWLAVSGAVFAGIPSFLAKMATKRNYNSELFILYGGILSIVVLIPLAFFMAGPESLSAGLILLALVSGTVASVGGIFKMYALHAIDATIYFPLVKVLSPALAIVAGLAFFDESFSPIEWIGLLIGVFVPLLLISKFENSRQNNLLVGLVLVLITGLISVFFSAVSKYAIDLYGAVLWFAAISSVGVIIGSTAVIVYKQGYRNTIEHFISDTSKELLWWSSLRALLITISFTSLLLAYSYGGPLGIVHTIHSLYILIPIVLSIIVYHEHWNMRKAFAIALSIAALVLLG